MYDLAVTVRSDGELELHVASCLAARAQAENGEPVLTMFGCERMPNDLPRHTCLEEEPASLGGQFSSPG